MIWEYIETIGFYLLCFTVFSKLLSFLFMLIQIPFALIGRGAVYVVLAFRTYFLSLFFAIITLAAVASGYIALPFILIFSPVLFAEIVAPFDKSDNDSSANTYISYSAFAAVIIYFVLYFSGHMPGSEIPLLFMRGVAWVFETAVLGDILSFFSPFISFVTCLLVVVHMAFILFAFFAALFGKLRKKEKPVKLYAGTPVKFSPFELIPVKLMGVTDQAQRDQIVAEVMRGSTNPYTGVPITCEADFEAYKRMYQERTTQTPRPAPEQPQESAAQPPPDPAAPARYRKCANCDVRIPYPEYETQTLCRICRAKAEALFLMREESASMQSEPPSAPRPAPLYCRLCGAQLHEDSLFCEYCGTPIPINDSANK